MHALNRAQWQLVDLPVVSAMNQEIQRKWPSNCDEKRAPRRAVLLLWQENGADARTK